MSAYATYELLVDLDGDRDFSEASENISAYVRSASTQHGMSAPWQEMGRSATATIRLDNTGGLFSPEGASALSGFDKGCLVQLSMTYASTSKVLYKGRIDHLDPEVGTRGQRTTQIVCEGFISQLQRGEVRIATRQDATSDEIISAILENTSDTPPFVTGWRLGVTGFSGLGATTTLAAGVTDYATLDAGAGTFAYSGDNWRDGTSPYRAIRDVVVAERGKFFEDQSGLLKFWSRHRLPSDLRNAVDATLTGAVLQDAEYRYGEDLTNVVEVNYNPRRLTGITVLGTLDEPVKVPYGKPKTVTIRFNDDTGARVSGINVIAPRPYEDWQAEHGSVVKRKDLTKYVDIKMVASGDKAELTFTLTQHVQRATIKHLQIRGQRLLDNGRQKTEARDDTSIVANGLQRTVIDSTLLQDTDLAADIAEWELAARGSARGNLRSVAFLANGSSTLMALARSVAIGDRWALSETQTGASGQWFVVGLLHEMRPRYHKVTAILEPIPATTIWLLGATGYGELGTHTTLGV